LELETNACIHCFDSCLLLGLLFEFVFRESRVENPVYLLLFIQYQSRILHIPRVYYFLCLHDRARGPDKFINCSENNS
jgi:hypothetical protein